jgi:hypothetical protein
MNSHHDLRAAGVLRRGRQRLKLYVLGLGDVRQDVDAALIQRLTQGLTVDPTPVGPVAGFLLLKSERESFWRCSAYLWSDDGLTRSILNVDLATGLRCRAPDAAFHVGCEQEVALIAAELTAWRTAHERSDPVEAYLETQFAC